MSPDLLFGLAWKSAACAGLTLPALRLLRDRAAAERSRVAHLGLLTAVAAPLAAMALPPLAAPSALPLPSLLLEPSAPASSVAIAAGDGASEAAATAASSGGLDLAGLAGWLHLGVATALALALLQGVLQLHALRARARMVTDPVWLTALASAQERAGFKQGVALLASTDVQSPVSWGVLRPVMILDEETAAEPGKAQAVVAHELAHLARLDWAKLLLGGAATALLWFNPLVWILARRCHELREEAADDAVLRGEVRAADYAELLVGCARRETNALLIANGMAPSPGSVARRIGRVLDPSRRRGPARAGWTLGCCGAALVLAAPLAVTVAPASGSAASSAAAAAVGRQAGASATPSAAPVLGEALVAAAARGDRTSMDALLSAGASPDAMDPGDGSPLIQAARTGRADMVRTLLARGADIDMAVSGDGNPLIAAAAAGRTDMVRLLLDAGADIEASIPSDENALIQASGRGREEVVRLLIARGADVNSRVGVRTPLSMARSGRHARIEQMLLEAGARR